MKKLLVSLAVLTVMLGGAAAFAASGCCPLNVCCQSAEHACCQ